MRNKYDWIDFYEKFANKLLEFKDNRTELISKLKAIYEKAKIRFPKIEKDNKPFDVDPFTAYALFNKGIRNETRQGIIEGLIEEFSVDASVPTDFEGIPVLNNLSATFYDFVDYRKDDDIQHLWDLFVSAIELADGVDKSKDKQKDFTEKFDVALTQGRVKWNLTMGLYWARPNKYMNLDSRNRWFLSNPKSAPNSIPQEFAEKISGMKEVPNGEEYLELCDECRNILNNSNYDYKTFPELSLRAWVVSEEDNERVRLAEQASTLGDSGVRETHYWMYAPGEQAYKWDEFYEVGIMGIGWNPIGDLSKYKSKTDMIKAMKEEIDPDDSFKASAGMTWDFANEIQIGDIVYAKKGRSTIIGRGIVESDYRYDPETDEDYYNIRDVNWTHSGEWAYPEGYAPMKTLTDMTNFTNIVETLESLFVEEGTEGPAEPDYPQYTKGDFLHEVYLPDEEYDTLAGLLERKKNIVLQGAPGVGKTFIAKRLAYSIIGEKNPEQVMMVQFHQSYSYEDFVMGFRPKEEGFELRRGAFYNFCKKAEEDFENPYYFIIDEINRGNLSKIFGELFMLIENDKRGRGNKIRLLYSDENFYVPENVYIIGMMNTADRSLAMLDYALRRRFDFYELKPAFDSDGFKAYLDSIDDGKLRQLVQTVKSLNQAIAQDESLGEGFEIGHSYFCNLDTDSINEQTLSDIVEYEIIPTLKEYWFDEPLRVDEWSDNLRRAIR